MSLNACRQHFINDVGYLGIFAKENLNRTKTDSKRDVAYVEHVLYVHFTDIFVVIKSTFFAIFFLISSPGIPFQFECCFFPL